MYFGEAVVYQHVVKDFMDIANEFEIKDLFNKKYTEEEFDIAKPDADDDDSSVQEKNASSDSIGIVHQSKHDEIITQDSDHQSDDEDNQKHHKNRHDDVKPFVSQVKSGILHKSKNRDKIYCCENCGKQFAEKKNLQRHNKSMHEGVPKDVLRYTCEECNKEFSEKSNLNRHLRSKHQGVLYYCDQCDHQANDSGNLKKHQEHKHLGVRYSCDQCEHQSTTTGGLKVHRQILHQGIRYCCDLCPFEATIRRRFEKHLTLKHEDIKYSRIDIDSLMNIIQ